MTPIFDQLARELGFVEMSELPAVRATVHTVAAYVPFGYSLEDLYQLKARLERYQAEHALPVDRNAPYYVNRENQSLQMVTITTPSDMVERCLPSKETCMTLDEIPGGQEHGVVIPPDPTQQERLVSLMSRNPEWVQRYNLDNPHRYEFQHSDLRGFVAEFDEERGRLVAVDYFDQGDLTMVKKMPGYGPFDNLCAAIVDKDLWLGHLERLRKDEPDEPVDLDSEQEEVRRREQAAMVRHYDELAKEEADRLIAEAKGRATHAGSDGKFLNPGAVIANRHHIGDFSETVESGGVTFRRNPTTGAVSADSSPKPWTVKLPPDVAERFQERLQGLQESMQKVLGGAVQQPASVYATGPDQEILREAATTISTGRQDDYGHAEDSFATIAGMWESYLSARFGEAVELDGRDVAMMMSLLKVARDASSRKRDNLVDLAGYAALAERTRGSDR